MSEKKEKRIVFQMRTTPEFLTAIDNWIRSEPGRIYSRTEAVHELCRRAIASKDERVLDSAQTN